MVRIGQDGGFDFESAKMPQGDMASPQSLMTDRTAHFERAAHLARDISSHLDAVFKDPHADAVNCATCKDLESTNEYDKGMQCIRNMISLRSEIVSALRVQDQLWEGAHTISELSGINAPHIADAQARRLLVACNVHLSLNNHDDDNRVTDSDNDMLPAQGMTDQVHDLYEEIARTSLRLVKETLRQFLTACYQGSKDKS